MTLRKQPHIAAFNCYGHHPCQVIFLLKNGVTLLVSIRAQSWVHEQALGRHASLHACNVVIHVMITKGLFSRHELGPKTFFRAI